MTNYAHCSRRHASETGLAFANSSPIYFICTHTHLTMHLRVCLCLCLHDINRVVEIRYATSRLRTHTKQYTVVCISQLRLTHSITYTPTLSHSAHIARPPHWGRSRASPHTHTARTICEKPVPMKSATSSRNGARAPLKKRTRV